MSQKKSILVKKTIMSSPLKKKKRRGNITTQKKKGRGNVSAQRKKKEKRQCYCPPKKQLDEAHVHMGIFVN